MRRLIVAALLFALPAAAQPLVLLPGIGANDPRGRVDGNTAPWRAIGRVQTELGGRCTGVLVAPDRVLTAAHCLVAIRTRRFVQPGSVHFLLGYDRGAWAARARVTGFTTGGYDPARADAGADPGAYPGADWAVLALDAPIGTPDRILPLLRVAPPPRTPVMLGGYQQDRPEVILADTGCRIVGLQSGPGGQAMLAHDCAGTRGASGAPLLARMPDGRFGVVGVVSTTSPDIALGHAVPAAAIRWQERP